MKSLVTGGAGFIGSHLAEKLVSLGHRVVVIDNLSSGRMENIDYLIKKGQVDFINADLSVWSEKWRKLFKNIDWVFHLAALADIVPSIAHPLKYHRANVEATVSVLEAVRRSKIKKFIYAASSSCYGIPDKYPTDEKAKISPQYPYALTKYVGEQYVLHYGKVYNLPVITLRLFNVYGPKSRTNGTYGAVFGTFLTQKINNKPFTVVGNGTQKRDFIFVSDVVDAFIKTAQSRFTGEVFNVGSGKPRSINYLVKLLGGKTEYISKRPGEPDCTWADISKIKKSLGWQPKVSFEKGVGIMLKNIAYWSNAPVWTAGKIKKATHVWFKYLWTK